MTACTKQTPREPKEEITPPRPMSGQYHQPNQLVEMERSEFNQAYQKYSEIASNFNKVLDNLRLLLDQHKSQTSRFPVEKVNGYITQLQQLQENKGTELKNLHSAIKTLSGLVPIAAYGKEYALYRKIENSEAATKEKCEQIYNLM